MADEAQVEAADGSSERTKNYQRAEYCGIPEKRERLDAVQYEQRNIQRNDKKSGMKKRAGGRCSHKVVRHLRV